MWLGMKRGARGGDLLGIISLCQKPVKEIPAK